MPRDYYVNAARRERTIEVLHRFERGLLAYDRSSKSELRVFVRNRGLQDTIPATTLKPKMLALLEAADNAATFDRFLELPPELRLRVYELHFDSFGLVDIAEQPPIAMVSRIIRREALPLFYHISCFTFTILSGAYSPSGPMLDSLSRSMVNRLTDWQLERIEHLHVNFFGPRVRSVQFKRADCATNTYFQKIAEDIFGRKVAQART